MTYSERERLLQILNTIQIPKPYVIAGSGSLLLQNVPIDRALGDLDIFVPTRTWFSIFNRPGWTVFTTNPNDTKRAADPPYLFKTVYGLEVNIFHAWRRRGVGDIDVAFWLRNPVVVDEAWPCVPANFILDWKEQVGREKDVNDIRILKEHLGR